MPKIITEEITYQCDFCGKNRERYQLIEIPYYAPIYGDHFSGRGVEGVEVKHGYLCKETCEKKPLIIRCGFCANNENRNPKVEYEKP